MEFEACSENLFLTKRFQQLFFSKQSLGVFGSASSSYVLGCFLKVFLA
jgi:hypothetical protein